MLKQFIIFLVSFLFILLSLISYLSFFKDEDSNESNFSKLTGESAVDLSTIIEKAGSLRVIQPNKISGSFTAKSDNLSTVSLVVSQEIKKSLIFRIKEVSEDKWSHEFVFEDEVADNKILKLSFPTISKSGNREYEFEVQSPSPFLAISQDYFYVNYKYVKSGPGKDPARRLTFLFNKNVMQLSLVSSKEKLQALAVSLFLSSAVSFLWIKRKPIRRDIHKRLGTPIAFRKKEIDLVFREFLLSFFLISFFLVTIAFWRSNLEGINKWIIYFSILPSSGLLGFVLLRTKLWKKHITLLLIGFSSLIPLVLSISSGNTGYIWFGIYGVLAFILFLLVTSSLGRFSLIFISVLIFLSSMNSAIFLNSHGTGIIYSLAICLVLVLSLFYFFYYLVNSDKWTYINKVFLLVLSISSFILSLRSDSLSLVTSELNWSYFTGVIDTMRGGGELLWSAPSQYGFLNIFIPYLLPWSSRTSFFIFEAFLLLTCSLFVLFVIYKLFRQSLIFVLMGIVFLSLFYFSDPEIIGPAPFPSSSVVRFFGVYLLIFSIIFEYLKGSLLNGRFKLFIIGSYIIGALWSAESFAYTTLIFLSYLFSLFFSIFKEKNDIKFATKILINSFSILLLSFVFLNLIYLFITKHLPDWSMYFMYALSYSSGFGEINILPWGVHWAGVVVLSAIAYVFWRIYSEKSWQKLILVSVAFVSLWALGSYYVGRAVPNNFGAILPLIFYIFILLLLVLKENKHLKYRLLLTSVFLPWIFVGVIGGFGNLQFLHKTPSFKFAQNIDAKMSTQDKELSSLLLGLSSEDRIVYYGFPYGVPVVKEGHALSSFKVGMPTPLLLLEKPISVQMRKTIVDRFLEKTNAPFYFVYKKHEANNRIAEWLGFLRENYSIQKSKETKSYVVYYVKRT